MSVYFTRIKKILFSFNLRFKTNDYISCPHGGYIVKFHSAHTRKKSRSFDKSKRPLPVSVFDYIVFIDSISTYLFFWLVYYKWRYQKSCPLPNSSGSATSTSADTSTDEISGKHNGMNTRPHGDNKYQGHR